jgi:hypothetical protein
MTRKPTNQGHTPSTKPALRPLTLAETLQVSGAMMKADPDSQPPAAKGIDFSSGPGTWTPSYNGGTYHA